ncbi:hypothetical protein CDAR_391401 [Caerostris darwini]|uniref:Uncharacterized protein n=1 Tax=Caerostris darwini TaxID=1538125 RepID=A0AAV4WA15_9ARAC|nr:hypothetical protein CDAR_391401 [Caerostris darwini]
MNSYNSSPTDYPTSLRGLQILKRVSQIAISNHNRTRPVAITRYYNHPNRITQLHGTRTRAHFHQPLQQELSDYGLPDSWDSRVPLLHSPPFNDIGILVGSRDLVMHNSAFGDFSIVLDLVFQ